jgi:4-amino-4-deoxy-L-arabinose transferase-like glycosyltransferase
MNYAGRVWKDVLDALSGAPPKMEGGKEIRCLLLVLASFAAGLAATWQRWGNPVVDAGRELNVPLRLLHGEMLYSDVRYIYGPFSPYVNAALYRIFEPSLWLMWGRGIVSTLILLALVYWLARQVTGRFSATFACVTVTWVCALKSQGNYMMPYAYAGLDGSILVLATSALLIVFLRRRQFGWLFAAGLLASLAVLAKTEMGLAAIGTGLVAAALGGYPRTSGIAARAAVFLAPSLGIPAAVYAWFAAQTSWHTLTQESYLFFGHVPWQLVYFNKLRFGFDRPWRSFGLMTGSYARLIAFGSLLAAVAMLLAKRDKAAQGEGGSAEATSERPVALLLISLGVIAVLSLGLYDLGPLMAMPLVLLTLIAAGLAAFLRGVREGSAVARGNAGVFVLLAAASLGCLMRILLRVSTGGSLSSFLLPGAIVLFIHVWRELFPLFLSGQEERRLARRIVSGVLALAVLMTAVSICVRYRRQFTYPLVTAKGTWRTTPEIGIAFAEALDFIGKKTEPGEAIAVLPEGSSLNFFSNRRSPLRSEINIPGIMDEQEEEQTIGRLRKLRVPVVIIANRTTKEFAQKVWGVDYSQTLMGWIERNYRVCGMFGPNHDPRQAIGDPNFFLRAYCRNP